MKSLKFILVAVFFAATTMIDANAGKPKIPRASNNVYLSLVEAIQNPGLVNAMHQQINPNFVGEPEIQYLTYRVTYKDHLYLITGAVEQWDLFFSYRWFRLRPAELGG